MYKRVLFLLLFLSTLGQAQSLEDFMVSKGYLIYGMATLDLDANRTGWWRLSAPVAVKYDLEVSEAFDQRRDPIWATQAAKKYWNHLYSILEDSVLADDAFVYGPSHARKLAQNAMAYLDFEFKIMSWKEMQVDSLPNLSTNGIRVTGSLYWKDMQEVFAWTPAQLEYFYSQNPSIQGSCLSLGERAYLRFEEKPNNEQLIAWSDLATRSDSLNTFALYQARERISNHLPDPTTHERTVYKVRSGDVLGAIANRNRVVLADLKLWNGLRSDIIRIGQELVIYRKRGTEVPIQVAAVVIPSSEGQVRSDEEGKTEVKYKVRTGDTLWKIARLFPGVSADDIMRWNGINEDIREGQELLILIDNEND